MVDFFRDWNLNKEWKRKISRLYPRQHFGLKVGICAICGNEDYIFPSGELKMCDRCYTRMKDNGAEIQSDEVEVNLLGTKCDVCGANIKKYHRVHTYICNKCTRRIGQQAQENAEDIRFKIGARKIA